jgi:surface protein
MPQPKNRFQIKLDGVVKTDPENWISFTPTTQRHSVYRSLLTTFSEGKVKLIKTAKNYVDAAYALYGPTASIDVEWLEYDYATDAYVAIYALGRINLSEKYERSRNYTEVGFEPTGFVMNILNRDEIKSDLQNLIDMDGVAITPFTNETHTVTLSDQIIDYTAKFKHPDGYMVQDYTPSGSPSTMYVPLPLFKQELANNNQVIVLDSTTGIQGTAPTINQLQFNEDGDVDMTFEYFTGADIYIYYGHLVNGYNISAISTVSLIYVLNNGSEVVLDTNTFPVSDPGRIFRTLTVASLPLAGIVAGEVIRFYIKLTNLNGTLPPQLGVFCDAETTIIQGTVYPDTTCKFMLPWEAFLRMCQKITGRNDCLRSTLFGRTDGEVKTYGTDGDGAFYALTTSKLMRGFPINGNPINADLMSIFKGYDKLLLLGLGVVYESGVPYVVIERLEHFMDGSSSVATFTAAYPGIDWTAAISYLWGNAKAGYSKYKLEKEPTISSPHSQRVYTVPFLSDITSKVYDNTCSFISSGHLIEIIRRDRYDRGESKDGKYDEDLIVLHLKRNGGTFERVLDTDFSAVTNIDNPTTNSNLHLTPARNILRQAPLLLAGLVKKIIYASYTGYLRYASGTGNTEAQTTVSGETLVDEGADLTRAQAAEIYSSTPLFDASEMGNCTVKVTKAQRVLIKEGLLNAISVIDRDNTYTGFIESIKEVDLEKGVAKLKFLSNTNIIAISNEPFIYTITTTSINQVVSIPMSSGLDSLYDFTIVDYGDGGTGSVSAYADADRTHTYAAIGTYQITIRGQFDYIKWQNDPTLLVSVQEFGSAGVGNASFDGCSNLSVISSTTGPGVYNNNLNNCFRGATAFNSNISNWDTSAVTTMSGVFNDATTYNNGGVALTWNVTNVTRTDLMFKGATAFNQSLSSWATATNTYMLEMFYNASTFNQDLSSWNVSNVTNMVNMFNNTSAFNQDLSSWNVSSVTSMLGMFRFAGAFNNGGAAMNWTTSATLTNTSYMFSSASAFNQSVSGWNVSAVTSFGNMFSSASAFNQSLSSWNVSSATNMQQMFNGAYAFNNGAAAMTWTMGAGVTTMYQMFNNASAFNQSVSGWNVSAVTTMYHMFKSATLFNQDVSAWNISAVTDMTLMFSGSALSTANYDLLLVAWQGKAHQLGVVFGSPASYTQSSVDSGTTDGTTTGKLVDSTQNFISTVLTGDIVHNTTDDTYSKVTAVDSNTVLSISGSVIVSGKVYTIQSSAAAKARYELDVTDSWNISDAGPI